MPYEQFFSYIIARTSNNLHDNNVRFVLDQNALLDFYSDSSLKQQLVGRDVIPLGHILIPSQPFFDLIPWCCMLNKEAANTNYIIFGLTRLGLEPTI